MEEVKSLLGIEKYKGNVIKIETSSWKKLPVSVREYLDNNIRVYLVNDNHSEAVNLPARLFETNTIAEPKNSEELYQTKCFACHGPAAAALNAPQVGVKSSWEPRLHRAGGIGGLLNNAISGVPGTAMAPRGGSSLSDDELQRVIEYMLNKSGV